MAIESERIPVRICPSCREEFQPHVTECLDCGGATVPGWEGEPLAAGSAGEAGGSGTLFESPEEGADLRGFEVVVRTGSEDWVSPLLQRLRRAGVESRVAYDPRSCGGGAMTLVVLVRPQDEERAREIELKTYVRQIPDLPGSLNRATTDVCPACRTPVRPNEAECPDCGLVLAETDPACGCGDGSCATGPEAGVPGLEGGLSFGRERRG